MRISGEVSCSYVDFVGVRTLVFFPSRMLR